VGTEASTYLLQTCGYPAVAEGNIIYMDEVKLGVIDACSGLGMLMTFFALSTAVALVIERRRSDKLAIIASAIPIALIANIARITASGMVYWTWGEDAGSFLHDWAGWLMMPLALALLWLELRFLDRLLTEGPVPGPLQVYIPGQAQTGHVA
jgi:exosortase